MGWDDSPSDVEGADAASSDDANGKAVLGDALLKSRFKGRRGTFTSHGVNLAHVLQKQIQYVLY